MINTKKIAAILLVAGLTCNPFNIPSTTLIHAEEAIVYKQASVVSIDNLDEYDTKASISWSCELIFPEDSDKGSGVKSAKLNGKTITSGKKVSKKGTYTLKVTDKANNTKTVKFKIKK